MKVVINTSLTQEQLDRVKSVSEDVQVVRPDGEEDLLREVADAEAILGGFNRALFERATRLKWVQAMSAGVDGLLFPEFVESDVILTSAKGYVGPHLADHTWALILGLVRGIGRAARQRTWTNVASIRDAAWEFGGRTLGIIGLGGTGIEVAKRAQGFDMRVIAVDPEAVTAPSSIEAVWRTDRFHDLLGESDVVSICCPLTKETDGLLDYRAFQHMKRHALLVNVARGKIVNGPDLMRALDEGLIGGAGLDVTPEEPLPPESPLWDMPNVIITPHVAGGSPLRDDRTVGLFCDNLARLLKGEPLVSVIDKRTGY